MSRATLTSVFSVAGDSAVASSAHASLMPRPVLVATATAGTVVAAPCRKTRRLYLLLRSTSLMGVLHRLLLYCFNSTKARCRRVGLTSRFMFLFGHDLLRKTASHFSGSCLAEPAAFLDHLDLVSIGIGNEEEARQRLAVVLEVAQRPR